MRARLSLLQIPRLEYSSRSRLSIALASQSLRRFSVDYAPKLKKRTALFERLREIFRQHVSWPVETVIAKTNPVLRLGELHSGRTRGRKGFSWTR
jgi:hypothetical protein